MLASLRLRFVAIYFRRPPERQGRQVKPWPQKIEPSTWPDPPIQTYNDVGPEREGANHNMAEVGRGMARHRLASAKEEMFKFRKIGFRSVAGKADHAKSTRSEPRRFTYTARDPSDFVQKLVRTEGRMTVQKVGLPVSASRSSFGMLLKIPNRSDQAFWVDLSRLLDDFVRLLRCIPLARWLGAPLGFRLAGLIYFHALPPQLWERWFT
jgi:hypothetical protein